MSSIKDEVSRIQHRHKSLIHPFNKDSFMQIKIRINIYYQYLLVSLQSD